MTMELTEKDYENIEAALEFIIDTQSEDTVRDYNLMVETWKKVKVISCLF